MYEIENNILNAFESDNREIAVRCTFNDNSVIDGEYIKKIEITDIISGDTTLSLGNTCSNQLKLDMFLPDDFVGLGNAKIKVELGINIDNNIEYVPMGIFYVDSFKSNSDFKSVTITAYDAMQRVSELGDTYKCELSANNVSPIDVINDIAEQAGLTTVLTSAEYVNTSAFLEKKAVANVSVSPRAMLGYMAALIGGNAKIDRNGNVTVKLLKNTGYTISGDTQFMSGFTKNITAELQPAYLTSGIQNNDGTDKVVTVGSGTFGFNFSNPYFTTIIAENVLGIYAEQISFITGSVNYRCNPALESGDIVLVEDNLGNYNNFLIKSQTITISGGLKSVLNCDIDTEANAQFISAPRNKTVSQSFSNFDRMYQDIISKLTGNQGGYVKFVYDEYGKMRAIAIPKTDIDVSWDNESGKVISEGNVPMWVWSKGGLSYSPDGGTTYNVAMNSEGQIFANYLQSPLGNIGGWIVTEEKIYQRVEEGDKTYEFTLKSDVDASPKKKAIYCNIFSNGKNSEMDNADDYKTESFYIRRNGEVMFKSGVISSWNFNENFLYRIDGDYETYIGNPNVAYGLVFAVGKNENNSGVSHKFYVNREGDAYIGNTLILDGAVMDNGGNEVMSPYRNDNYVFGFGSFNKGYKTYLMGGTLHLNYKEGKSLQIIDGSTPRFTFENKEWKFNGIDSSSLKRNTLTTSGGFVLNANDGNNTLYLNGSSIRMLNATRVYGNLTVDNILSSNYLRFNSGGSLQVQDGTTTRFTFSNSGWTFGGIDTSSLKRNTLSSAGGFVLDANGGSNTMYLVGSSIRLRSDTYVSGDLVINFHSTSGLAPLYVNSSGVISPTSSSERYKENITEELGDWLNPERLYDLPVVQYDYKNEFKDIELVAGTQIGITAEDVHEHYPNACIYNEKGEPESWQDRIMIPAMLKLIQEQKKEIDELKNEQIKLNERLLALEKAIKK